MAAIPKTLVHLLTDPNYGSLATVRPDGMPQVNPMWFLYDEATQTIRFTHTIKRAKYRNLQANPRMALCVLDPENPYSFLEVRGRLIETIPDPEGAFYPVLGGPIRQPGHTGPSGCCRSRHPRDVDRPGRAEIASAPVSRRTPLPRSTPP